MADAKAREMQALDELHEHAGPIFDHWRRRLAASVGAVISSDSAS